MAHTNSNLASPSHVLCAAQGPRPQVRLAANQAAQPKIHDLRSWMRWQEGLPEGRKRPPRRLFMTSGPPTSMKWAHSPLPSIHFINRSAPHLGGEAAAVLAVGSQEHIAAGQVAMKDVVGVQVRQCRRDFLQRLPVHEGVSGGGRPEWLAAGASQGR